MVRADGGVGGGNRCAPAIPAPSLNRPAHSMALVTRSSTSLSFSGDSLLSRRNTALARHVRDKSKIPQQEKHQAQSISAFPLCLPPTQIPRL